MVPPRSPRGSRRIEWVRAPKRERRERHARASPRPFVLIASYLEPEHVDRICSVDARLDVVYEPVSPAAGRARRRRPRGYAGRAFPGGRGPAGGGTWPARTCSSTSTTRTTPSFPTSALGWFGSRRRARGSAPFVKRRRYDERMPSTVFTTASGVHARPLAEFCALAMLAFSRGLFVMLEAQRRATLGALRGLRSPREDPRHLRHGSIGEEVGRIGRSFGLRTIGIKRTVAGQDPAALHVDELHPHMIFFGSSPGRLPGPRGSAHPRDRGRHWPTGAGPAPAWGRSRQRRPGRARGRGRPRRCPPLRASGGGWPRRLPGGAAPDCEPALDASQRAGQPPLREHE